MSAAPLDPLDRDLIGGMFDEVIANVADPTIRGNALRLRTLTLVSIDAIENMRLMVAALGDNDDHSKHVSYLEPQPKDDGYYELMSDLHDTYREGK